MIQDVDIPIDPAADFLDFFHREIGDDQIQGGAGNDHLISNNGHDTLDGGPGDDELDGADGRNILDGGSGFDDCNVGLGNNTLTDCER